MLARLWASLLVALLLPLEATAKPLWERRWIEVRTPHFAVMSSASEEDTVTLASDLESFRSTVRKALHYRVEERVPTRVFVAPEGARDFGIGSQALGWFRPEMRQNTAVVGKGGGGLTLTVVLFHEYTHFLVRNQGPVAYPPWFDEGFAEVLMTMRFKDQYALVGDLVPARRDWLFGGNPWLPYQKILRTRDYWHLTESDRQMFYAQSWALVHFLMLGPERAHFGDQMAKYLSAVEKGQPDATAFEAAFGIEPAALPRKILAYFKRAKLMPVALGDQPGGLPSVHTMALDEIAMRLGQVALVSGDLELAQQAFDDALAANPSNAGALAGSADLHKFAGRYEQAEPLYRRAIELEPKNPYHLLDYGEYFLDRARASTFDPFQAGQWVTEARRQFARSYALDENIPETLAMNGASYLGDPSGKEQAVASLEVASNLLPGQPQIKFLLAQAYARSDQRAEAIRLLRSLLAWDHADDSGAASAMLRQLEAQATPTASAPGTAD
jgi:tetratricopeptide (TPR) repeat protein